MAARRDRIAPYELMRQGGQPAAPRAEDADHAPDPSPPTSHGAAWWSWAGAGVPIVLRVPRGMAVAGGVALVGLLVLAYWVGYTRGGDAARVELDLAQERPAMRLAPAAPDFLDDTPGTATAQQAAGRPSGTQGGQAGRDPREPGLNYLILARYPQAEARRLAAFLATQGVETALDPVNNGDYLHVVAVERGFGRSDFGSEAMQAYERRMRAAGRAWKRHNDNRGDALETMYFAKYEGP